MDFVQRNLINERNNLQVELAKAKALIAQLNENAHVNAVHDALDDAEKHYDPQHGPIGKSYRNDAIPHFKIARAALDAAKATGVEGKHLDKANSRYHNMMGMMPKEGHDYGPGEGGVWVPKGSYDEQTEYISDLENVIVTIAEQLGVHPNDLLNELNVGGAIMGGFKAGGVIDAIKAGANAVGHNVKQTLRGGSVVPTAANRADSTAQSVGADYFRATSANLLSDRGRVSSKEKAANHLSRTRKALQGIRKITNNRGMDDAVSPALDRVRNGGY